MASQTTTLFGARLAAIRNARRSGAGAFSPAIAAAAVIGAALIVGLGYLAAPSLLAAPTETSAPNLGGRAPVVGDAALEAAFWLAALLSAFFAFRVMESLFRADRMRALELLPVRPGPIFVERVVNALVEAIALASVVGLFFAPLIWMGAPLIGALCIAMGLGATLCTAGVTIGTNAWMGAQYGGSSGIGDAYGGHGGAFIYAPVVSFALAIVCVLLFQLGAREVVHAGEVTNAVWLAVGLAAGGALATLLVGARHFIASYHRVAAFFREADEVGFRAVMDYQESSWAAGWFETGARGEARYLVRRHAFQFARRFPVARTVVAIGAVAGAIGAVFVSPEAFPTWAVALLPATLIVVLERPFSRLDDEHLGGASDALLPLSAETLEAARMHWTAAEIARVALPYSVVVAVARGWTDSLLAALVAGSALPLALAVAALVALARRLDLRSPGAAIVVSVAGCTGLGALFAANPAIGIAVAVAAVFAGATLLVGQRRRGEA